MDTHILALQWLWYTKADWKLWRVFWGGLWVHFDNGTWVRCQWYYPHVGEYIRHPQDGGMFSVKLKNIVKLENYSWGHTK
jgi:hypothetical protein